MAKKNPFTPRETSICGKDAPWTPEIKKKWKLVIAAHFDGETRAVLDANYYTPRPYVDQYNSGSREEGFTYTLGGSYPSVCYHILKRLDHIPGAPK